MKRIALFAILTLALSSCGEDPLATKSTDNPNLPVGILFEIDGCKVYRFRDAGQYVYFTNCRGSTTAFHSESCGKGCTRSVPIAVRTELRL